MKKTLAKILAIALCAILLVSGTVYITLAYLQSQSNVVQNTFSVSNIAITLDEAKVNALGVEDTEADRVVEQEQAYKLIPGTSYVKDPTVHVKATSEPCFIVIAIHDTVFGKGAGNTFEDNYNGDNSKVYDQIAANGWNKLTGAAINKSILDSTAGMEDWNGDYTLYYYDTSANENEGAIIATSSDDQDFEIFDGFKLLNDIQSSDLTALEGKVFEVVAFAMQTTGYGADFDAATSDGAKISIAFIETFGEEAPATEPGNP